MQTIIFLITLWLFYFLIHSLMASVQAKKAITQALPTLANYYRLIYNFLAVILLLPLFYLMYVIPSPTLWQWTGNFKIVANLLALFALLGFAWSLKFYNNMDFLGFSQLKNETSKDAHQFTLSPLHRFVRHPWYFFALILIWTRDMNAHFLVSSLCMTSYFILGSIVEERKLVVEFGKVYQDYQRAVPGLIPSFRRFLTADKAKNLMKKYTK